MKAFQALFPHAAQSIKRTELGDSDFRVLEVLLHKGPLPVNTIGPKVWLTPGSISVAVDRLVEKGVDFIKVQSQLSREAYFAIAETCRAEHWTFSGHVPDRVTAWEASDADGIGLCRRFPMFPPSP